MKKKFLILTLCLCLLLPMLSGCFYLRTESRDQFYRFMPSDTTLQEFFEVSIPKENIKKYLYKKKNSAEVRVQAKVVLTSEAWEQLREEMTACGYEVLTAEHEDYPSETQRAWWREDCDWWDVDDAQVDCYRAYGGLSMCKCSPERYVYVQADGEDVALYFAYLH